MKIKYEASLGSRIKYGFTSFEDYDFNWQWNLDLKRWDKIIDRKYSYSSHAPCKSIRSFRRMLKSAPKGVRFMLWSKWQGYNVHGIGNCKNIKL